MAVYRMQSIANTSLLLIQHDMNLDEVVFGLCKDALFCDVTYI